MLLCPIFDFYYRLVLHVPILLLKCNNYFIGFQIKLGPIHVAIVVSLRFQLMTVIVEICMNEGFRQDFKMLHFSFNEKLLNISTCNC